VSRRLPRRSTFLIAACDELTDLSLIGSTAAHENFILVPQRARELPRRAADAEGPPHTAVASEEVTDSDHSVCSLPDVSVGWIVRESTIRFRPTIVPYLGYRWIIQSETSRRLDFCPWRPASRPLDECCRLSRKTHVGKGGERGAELRPATSLVQLGHALSSRFGRQIAEGGRPMVRDVVASFLAAFLLWPVASLAISNCPQTRPTVRSARPSSATVILGLQPEGRRNRSATTTTLARAASTAAALALASGRRHACREFPDRSAVHRAAPPVPTRCPRALRWLTQGLCGKSRLFASSANLPRDSGGPK